MFAPDCSKHTGRSVPSRSFSFLTRGKGGPVFHQGCVQQLARCGFEPSWDRHVMK